MPAQAPTPRIFGFLKSLGKGIDSNKAPLELPANQAAFATNATMRGDFINTRPNFFNMTLVDNTGGAFQSGLFQGASYFLTTTGIGEIMMAIGGQLFQLTPSGQNTLAVSQVTLPDSGNSETAVQNWLWQSERWLIWNDGINLPMFYDGTTARRSIGPRQWGDKLAQIGNLLQNFVVPPQAQTVTVQVTPNVSQSEVGLSFLLNNMQFTLQAVSSSATVQSVNLATNVIQSVVGDSLVCQTNSVGGGISNAASFFSNDLYAATIAGVTQNGQSITDWGNIAAPGANGTIALTTGSGMTVDAAVATETNTEVECYGNPALAQAYAFKVGDAITLNGNGCTVQSITHGTLNTAGNATGIVVQPTKNYTGPINNDNSVDIEVAYTLGLRFFIKSAFFEKATVTTKTGLPAKPPNGSTVPTLLPNWNVQSTSSNLFTWDSLNNQNYFTVSLNQTPVGLNSTTPYTFTAFPSAGSASTVGVTFTGYWGGTSNPLSLVNCTMSAPPPVGNSIALISGFATAVNQYVQVTLAAGKPFATTPTPRATLYNVVSTNPTTFGNLAIAGPTQTLPIQTVQGPNGNIPPNTLIFAVAIDGNTDAFISTGASLTNGTSGTWASFINQTGTPGATITAGTAIIPLPELPISTIGVYGEGRNWVALPDGISFLGSDIVGGSSGDIEFNYTDSVLKVSQNLFLSNGTTFKIPGSGERITAMQFVACLDASLGQGPLQVFTQDTVFSVNTPSDATTWANLSSPILTESLIGSGGISNNDVTQSNADLIFRTPDGGVQSMLLARLDYNQWGVTPISTEIVRITQDDTAALLPYCSAVVFNNRRLMTCNDYQSTASPASARGVYFQAMAVLNYDAISTLQGKAPSIWEGQWVGLNILQLVTGTFSGVKRCLAICVDAASLSQIEVHEILLDTAATVDDIGTDVVWSFESPMLFQKEQEHEYKRLVDGEIYLDQITSNGVQIKSWYRVDQNNAWTPWYSTTVNYQPNDTGFRPRIGLGQPNPQLYDAANNRPLREGYDFQVMLQFTGSCRFLGGRFAADLIPQPTFTQPR